MPAARLTRPVFLAALALGLALRGLLLPLPGTPDVQVWRIWSYNAVRSGPATLYGIGGTPPERRLLEFAGRETTVDYPPVALYALTIAGRVHELRDPAFLDLDALTVTVKALPVAAEAVMCWVLYDTMRVLGAGIPVARWATLAYWLNPAALMNAAVLGYLDGLFLLPLAGALRAVATRRWWIAGACLAAAVGTKLQAALAVPVLLLATAASGGAPALAAACGSAMLVAVMVLAPIAAVGALPNLLTALASLTRHDMLSGFAANLWWLVTYVTRAVYDIGDYGVVGAFARPVERILAVSTWVDTLGLPNPRPLAFALVGGAALWALWRARRATRLDVVACTAAFVVNAYFVLGIQVHENHQIAALPFLALAAAPTPALRPLLVAVSAIVALNLNLFYGLGNGVGFAVPRGLVPPDTSVWLALANLGALVWHAHLLRRLTGPEAPQPVDGSVVGSADGASAASSATASISTRAPGSSRRETPMRLIAG